MRSAAYRGVILLAVILAASCATTQSRHSMLSKSYAIQPLSEDYEVEVFRVGKPQKPFVKISRLDVHLEKTHFIGSNFDDALPELKRQARQSGAQAIIDIEESKSQVGETMIYHVTATGIKYTDEIGK
jgi:hypothetical protein